MRINLLIALLFLGCSPKTHDSHTLNVQANCAFIAQNLESGETWQGAAPMSIHTLGCVQVRAEEWVIGNQITAWYSPQGDSASYLCTGTVNATDRNKFRDGITVCDE